MRSDGCGNSQAKISDLKKSPLPMKIFSTVEGIKHIHNELMNVSQAVWVTATAFTFKKYKKAPQAHVLGSRGMLSPLQGVNEGDSVPLTK